MQGQSSDFHARAAERLFVAVVNQAILDVLEHGEEAEEAKRWWEVGYSGLALALRSRISSLASRADRDLAG